MDIAHINRLGRALCCAGAAGQALVSNNKSHDIPSVKKNSDCVRAAIARRISLSGSL
jgi:hypothetical protein